MSGGWSCSHQRGSECDLLKKNCDPGEKGCILYGRALFSDPQNPSNAALKRREETQRRKSLREEMDDARFF